MFVSFFIRWENGMDFYTIDAPTFEEAIMSSPVTDLRQLEIFIGQQFEVMEKSPFLFR